MIRKFESIESVVAWRLCVGCGACAYICPEQNVTLRNFLDCGVQPLVVNPDRCVSCDECLKVCPSYSLDYRHLATRPRVLRAVLAQFGPVLEIWEGHARDNEIRYKGSSGGAITALALYCLDKRQMHGVLHIGPDPHNPLYNRTSLSLSRADLLSKLGSRYAPASACDSLRLMEDAPSPCVFIGRPAEVAALRKAQMIRPRLDHRVGMTISFFCAGSPSTQGTQDLLSELGVASDGLASLRYRGHGWPGHFAPTRRGESEPAIEMPYRESWKFLQAYRPYSAHLWPDDSGETADISCGDPWYREVNPGESGSSLVVVRTELGREMLEGAVRDGYLELVPADIDKLLSSQRNLANKRAAVWGRRWAFKICGIPVTRLSGFPLFKLWSALPLSEKLKSTFGTLRRILQRKYYRSVKLAR